jgi:hypothetical protein
MVGARILAYLCASFACVAIGAAALQAYRIEKRTEAAIAEISKGIGNTNAQAQKVLMNARLSLDNVNKAAIDERLYLERALPETMSHVNDLLIAAKDSTSALQQTEGSARNLLDEATLRVRDLEPLEQSATSLLSHSSDAIKHADDLASDPHVKAALVNIDSASLSVADAAKHLDGTAEDTQVAVHKFLHPSWGARIVNWSARAVSAVGSWF